MIEIFMLTSPAPWHPDTSMVERVLESTYTLLRSKPPITVYCDAPAKWVKPDERALYEEYLVNLEGLNVGPLVRRESYGGVPGAMQRMVDDLQADVALVLHHDLMFVDPERVDTQALLATMGNGIEYVRFSLRDLIPGRRSTGRLIRNPKRPILGLPLIPTVQWSDGAHFSTRQHLNRVRHLWIRRATIGDGRQGVEMRVAKYLRNEMGTKGFDAVQQDWGMFFYGRIGDSRYIEHLGDAMNSWRVSHGVRRNYD